MFRIFHHTGKSDLTRSAARSDRYTHYAKKGAHHMILKTTLQPINDSTLVPIVRRMAIHPLRELGVIEEDIERVAMIIAEACSNVVKHAYTGIADYMIDLEYCAERVTITIADHGRGFDYAGVKKPALGGGGRAGMGFR